MSVFLTSCIVLFGTRNDDKNTVHYLYETGMYLQGLAPVFCNRFMAPTSAVRYMSLTFHILWAPREKVLT